MMNATMELLPMTGWALIGAFALVIALACSETTFRFSLIGAFALVIALALAIIFFLRGLAMLRCQRPF